MSTLLALSVFLPSYPTPLVPIGGCLYIERFPSVPPRTPDTYLSIGFPGVLTIDHVSLVPRPTPFPPVFILKSFSSLELAAQTRTIMTVHPRDDMATTLYWDDGEAAPTMTATMDPEYTQTTQKTAAGDPVGPGVIGAIAVVSTLVVICMVVAAVLHQLWCMNPGCRACFILRCGRRKSHEGP